jgi:hypothetical protein
MLSLAHKRAAQNEAGKVVLDGELTSLTLAVDAPRPTGLLAALPLDHQPHTHLMALYQGWMDCLIAAQAERLTGCFTVPSTPDQAAVRRVALREYQRLTQETARLRALAAKENQIAKRVEHNLALQQLQADLNAAHAQLI